MARQRWDQRFFASTQGRVVMLLRRSAHTVNELAGELDLTDNAVRAHLTTLERDGLVQQEGLRRGAGKPSYAYELSPAAEELFPKAYASVLTAVVDVVREERGDDETRQMLLSAGERLAAPPAADASVDERVALAVQAIDALGGLAEVEADGDVVMLRGRACPLADVVSQSPDACLLAQSLLATATGLQVCECCDRTSDPPRCCFQLSSAPTK
ncbi:MAG: ArsR family transcriptional regulator [Thermomicrobiales bacterium]|nr:ArsR family transcriptional regulator [Thermomicrobiales bacterium]